MNMMNFTFSTVAQIISEIGASAQLGAICAERFPAVRNAMVITDAGFLGTGMVHLPLRSLETAGIAVHLYSNVVADPPENVVLEAVAFARDNAVDLVVGLGGGSSMDVAKLVAVLARSDQPITQIFGIGNVRGSRLPLVQVPTTAGTGSEVTNIAIVTTGASTKSGVVASQLYADIAILDAALTLGLPRLVTAATGIDAMVHAIEAYTSKHKKNPMSDMLARQALSLLSTNLLIACQDGANLAARQAMLLGACYAGQAFSNAPVAAVHALAYPIGGMFHVPHGLSNALVLPHILRFNASHAVVAYGELAEVIGSADGLIAAMEHIAEATGIVTRLRDVGITENDLDRLADDAMLQTRLLGNNPRQLTRADARAIYQAAL